MDKYLLLIVLNMPFVIFGLLKSYTMLSGSKISRMQFATRVLFWLIIGVGIVFARDIYEFLQSRALTDSQPLSLADVVLVTGISFCLFLCVRLYSKVDSLERRVVDLHQALSIKLSEKPDERK